MAQWRILVADDSADVTSVVDAVLRRDGRFEIYHARNGEDALALARLYVPHVIILDIMMPRVHGLKVCKTIKADKGTASVKVIMLSALGRQYTKNEAYQYGADAYMTKPFSPRDLVNTIEVVMRGERTVEEQSAPVMTVMSQDFWVFNRGDEVRVLLGAGEPEVAGVVKSRIPPGQAGDDEWGYRIGLATGGDAFVKWDQVMPAKVMDRAI